MKSGEVPDGVLELMRAYDLGQTWKSLFRGLFSTFSTHADIFPYQLLTIMLCFCICITPALYNVCAAWDEIKSLESQVALHGTKALATWTQNQVSLTPTSHRAYFRRRLNPRAVESYIYGIPGPKACEANARFRRFAFTIMDVELSRGSTSAAGNDGHPYTPSECAAPDCIVVPNRTPNFFAYHIIEWIFAPLAFHEQ